MDQTVKTHNPMANKPVFTLHSSPLASQVHTWLETKVSALDFSRLKFKNTQSAENRMTEDAWDFAEIEYRRFLQLKKLYPGISLVPSKQVDEIWHQHILDTRAYREDCEALFGHFLDHYPYFGIYGKDDYEKLQDAFKETVSLYEKHFGQYPNPSPLNATRCSDHACHAPSECACRVPGACK